MSAVGEKIKFYRKFVGWTQEQLAQKTELSVMSIRRYESGDRMPNQDTVIKIAKALGIAPFILLSEMYDDFGERIFPEEMPAAVRERIIENDEFKKLYEEFKVMSEKHGIIPAAGKYVEALRRLGYLPNEDEDFGIDAQNVPQKLLKAMKKLNDEGKAIAIQRVEELAEIPRYQAKPATEATKSASEGKDTPEE